MYLYLGNHKFLFCLFLNNGFHGRELKSSHLNNSNDYKCVNDLLDILSQFVTSDRIKVRYMIISQSKLDNNINYLEGLFRNILYNPTSTFYYEKLGLTEKEAIPIIKRGVHFFRFMYLRDRFGSSSDLYNYYPDTTGKVSNYEFNTIKYNGEEVPYFNFLKHLCNSVIDLMCKHPLFGWTEVKIHLNEFKPIDSKTDVLIQVCDVLSNLLLNYLRKLTGFKFIEEKTNAIEEIIDLHEIENDIRNSFKIQNNNIVIDKDDAIYILDTY